MADPNYTPMIGMSSMPPVGMSVNPQVAPPAPVNMSVMNPRRPVLPGPGLEEQLSAEEARILASLHGGSPPPPAVGPSVAQFPLVEESSFNPYDNIPGPNNPYTPDELAAGYEMMRADPQNAQLTQEANLQMAIDAAGDTYARDAAMMSQGMGELGTGMARAANQPAPSYQSNADFMYAGAADAYGGQPKQDPLDYHRTTSPFAPEEAFAQRSSGLQTPAERARAEGERSNKAAWDTYKHLLSPPGQNKVVIGRGPSF